MMPFNPPIPERKDGGSPRRPSSVVGAIVQAEKMMQIALILPCAAFIGWLLGAWLDKYLHWPWLPMAGIVLGIISGLVGAIQLAMVWGARPNLKEKNGSSSETEPTDRQP